MRPSSHPNVSCGWIVTTNSAESGDESAVPEGYAGVDGSFSMLDPSVPRRSGSTDHLPCSHHR